MAAAPPQQIGAGDVGLRFIQVNYGGGSETRRLPQLLIAGRA